MSSKSALNAEWHRDFPARRRYGMWNTLFCMEFVNAIMVLVGVIYSTLELNMRATYEEAMWDGLLWTQFAFGFVWLTVLVFHVAGSKFRCAFGIDCCRRGLGYGDSSLYSRSHWTPMFLYYMVSHWGGLIVAAAWSEFIMDISAEEKAFWKNRDDSTFHLTDPLPDYVQSRVDRRFYGFVVLATVYYTLCGATFFTSMYQHMYPDYNAPARLKRFNQRRDLFYGAGYRSCMTGICCRSSMMRTDASDRAQLDTTDYDNYSTMENRYASWGSANAAMQLNTLSTAARSDDTEGGEEEDEEGKIEFKSQANSARGRGAHGRYVSR